MTHITEARVIGSHADMGGRTLEVSCIPLTVTDILGAGRRRGVGRREMVTAESAWDSEGGATVGPVPNGRQGRAPRGFRS